jgi:predicted phosphodiesterase
MVEGYIEWVAQVFETYGVEEVVHIGDLLDHHAISFHTTETDALGPTSEMEAALEQLREMYRLFPNVKVCKGNHDELPSRKLKEMGLPDQWLKPLRDVYEMPPGWEVDTEWEIDGVLYTHVATGISGARNLAKEERRSVVVGHTHTEGKVEYLVNRGGERIFGMYTGCGVDKDSYAMRYGKQFTKGMVLGCGVVLDPSTAFFIPYRGTYV